MIPLPIGKTFQGWATDLIGGTGIVLPFPPDENSWYIWAQRLAAVVPVEVPRPDGFDDWRDWAQRLIQVSGWAL